MGFNFAGGISAATGFMQGRDDATARDNAEEDRKYMRDQRSYQAGQQGRVVQEQQRADTLRSDLSGINDTATTDMATAAPKMDDDGNAMPGAVKTEKVLPDVQLRQAAAAYGKAGDFGKAIELHTKADAIGWDRSAKSFQELQANAAAANVTAVDVAKQAAAIYDKDPFAGKVKNVRDDGSGGVVIDAVNRETGAVTSKAFANKSALLESLHAYYSPQTFAALSQKRQEALVKMEAEVAKERAKGHILPAGAQFVPGAGDTRKVETNYNRLVATGNLNPDGTPEMVTAPGAGRAGAGAGAGGKVDKTDPMNQARDILAKAAEKSEDKFTGDQRVVAERHIEQIFQAAPGVTPAVAAEVALKVAKNPSLMKPTLNANTGEIDGVFRDKQIAGGKPFSLAPNWMSVEEAQKATPDDKTFMQKAVAEMISKQGVGLMKTVDDGQGKMIKVAVTPDEVAQIQGAYIKAASDPETRQQLESAARAAAGEAGVRSFNRKMELISKFGPQAAAARGEKPANGPFRVVGLQPAIDRRKMADEARAKAEAEKNNPTPVVPALSAEEVQRLLVSGTPKQLSDLQGSPAFSTLDKATQIKIHNRLNGIK